MNQTEVIKLGRDALMMMLILGGPALITSLVVGTVVALLQAVPQLTGIAQHEVAAPGLPVFDQQGALVGLADRHHIVEKGRVVWAGTSTELARDRDLQHRYLGV